MWSTSTLGIWNLMTSLPSFPLSPTSSSNCSSDSCFLLALTLPNICSIPGMFFLWVFIWFRSLIEYHNAKWTFLPSFLEQHPLSCTIHLACFIFLYRILINWHYVIYRIVHSITVTKSLSTRVSDNFT